MILHETETVFSRREIQHGRTTTRLFAANHSSIQHLYAQVECASNHCNSDYVSSHKLSNLLGHRIQLDDPDSLVDPLNYSTMHLYQCMRATQMPLEVGRKNTYK